jgi:hypothetical protein
VRLPAGLAATAVLPAASAAPLPPSARVLPIPPAALPATVTAVAPGPGPAGAWEARLVLATCVAATTAAATTATATTAGSASGSASTGDTARSPLARPGEPCRVEVELGSTTPMDLALRALGWGSGRAPVSLHAPAAPEPAR